MKLRAVLLSAGLAVLATLSAVVPASADGIGTYHLTFRTADIPNAGTEDSVRVTIFGDLRQTPPMQFDKGFPPERDVDGPGPEASLRRHDQPHQPGQERQGEGRLVPGVGRHLR
jgi:hypothetical protein